MAEKITFVALYVPDVEELVALYRDKVGFPLKIHEEGFAEFETEQVGLAILGEHFVSDLLGSKSPVTSGGKTPRFHLSLEVEDVDKTYEELKAKGVEFTNEPVTHEWGQRVVYFRDLVGNLWEVYN